VIKFLAKIAAQHALSPPIMRWPYFFLQERVTRSTRVHPDIVRQKVDVGLMYLDRAKEAGLPSLIEQGPILDFGAGPFLTIPLLYTRLGAAAQNAVDIARLARETIVFDVVRELNRFDLGPRASHLLPEPGGDQALSDYLETLGIRYVAPVTVPLPIPSNSIGSVFCTQALLHPARAIVRRVFEETARLLRPGGVFVATMHLDDLYSTFDRSLSRFNFLRYSQKNWERWINSSLMSYNRLRASDYHALLKGLPFKTIIWDVTSPTEDDLKELSQIKVHSEFALYEKADLASTHLFFALHRL
jgi:SAM-dependent methyltransferase